MGIIFMKKFKIHYSFLLFVLLGILLGLLKEILIILLTLLIHEIGHLVFIKIFDYNFENIKLFPFGGVIKYKMKNDFLYKDFFITIGGVLFNLLFFLVLKPLNLPLLANLNLYFFLLNLIPLYPLDGGRILLLCLSMILPYRISKIITHIFSSFISLLVIIYLTLNFDGLYYLLFLAICIRINISSLIALNREYHMFLLLKHLNLNDKLKNKITKFWTREPILSLFYGKNTVFDFETFTVKEEVILNKYFNK